MKADFTKVIENKDIVRATLSDTLQNGKPFTIAWAVPTGYDFSSGDRLMRFCGKRYDYDDTLKQYRNTYSIDTVIEGTKESKERLSQDANKDLICQMAGITEEEYLGDVDTCTARQFEGIMASFIEAEKDTEALFINDFEMLKDGLSEFGLDSWLKQKTFALKCFDMERLMNTFYPAEAFTFEQLMDRDFNIQISDYKDECDAIRTCVTRYGLDENLLNKNAGRYLQEREELDAWIAKGKESYQKASVMEKLDVLLAKKYLMVESEIEDRYPLIYTPNISYLERVTREHLPIIIYGCSTTGLDADRQPLSLTMGTLVYDDEIGNYKVKANSLLDVYIKADAKKVLEARSNEDYPIFERAGIDFDEYLKACEGKPSSIKVIEPSRLEGIVREYLKPYEKYALVSNGGDKSGKASKGISFAGKALNNVCSLPFANDAYIDGSKLLQEYIYCKATRQRDFKDNLISLDSYEEKGFGLEEIASHYYETPKELIGSKTRVSFTAICIRGIASACIAEHEKMLEKEKKLLEGEKAESVSENTVIAEIVTDKATADALGGTVTGYADETEGKRMITLDTDGTIGNSDKTEAKAEEAEVKTDFCQVKAEAEEETSVKCYEYDEDEYYHEIDFYHNEEDYYERHRDEYEYEEEYVAEPVEEQLAEVSEGFSKEEISEEISDEVSKEALEEISEAVSEAEKFVVITDATVIREDKVGQKKESYEAVLNEFSMPEPVEEKTDVKEESKNISPEEKVAANVKVAADATLIALLDRMTEIVAQNNELIALNRELMAKMEDYLEASKPKKRGRKKKEDAEADEHTP